MNKFLIAGATGGIGKYLVNFLTQNNIEVVILSRNSNRSQTLFPNAYLYLEWRNPDELLEAIEQSDVIINLSGASIGSKRWTKKYRQEIYNSRIETTKTLVNLINKATSPKVFVSTSAIGIYPDLGEQEIDESFQTGNSFLARVCVDWENEAKKLNSKHRLIITRFAVVLKIDDIAIQRLLLAYKFGFGVTFGGGTNWFSWIHIKDLVRGILFLINNPNLSGAFNFSSPNPVRFIDFVKTVSEVLGKPLILNLPKLIPKIAFGKQSEVILSSAKVFPKRLIENNFTFEFDTIEKALEDILKDITE